MKKKLTALIAVPFAICALFSFAGCDAIASINRDGSITITPDDGSMTVTPDDGSGSITLNPGDNGVTIKPDEGNVTITPDDGNGSVTIKPDEGQNSGSVTIKPGEGGSQEGDITITPITPEPPPVEESNPNPSEYGSEGLEYTLSNDEKYYIVSGIGTCTETDIVIPSVFKNLPVTEIGKEAFSGCSELTSVQIPDSITSIEKEAFRGCKQLTSIIIPDSVDSIGNFAFSRCENLISATLPKSMRYIPEGMFTFCENLTNVTIPESVTWIGGQAFRNCAFTSINIPNGVTSIAFFAFEDCSNLTSITIPNGVTTIADSVFSGCSSLTSITIPDGVTTIRSKAFDKCSNLANISLPNSITSISEGVFDDTLFYNDAKNWDNGSLYINNYLIRVKTTLSGDYEIKPGTVLIASYAFFGCSNLTNITIPDSVISIGGYDAWGNTFSGGSFGNCSSLTSITIPSSVTYFNTKYAFSGCSNLTSVTLSSGVTKIGISAFENCSSLTSITLPCVDEIEKSAFWFCYLLSRIIVESPYITIASSAFEYSGLTCITFDDTWGTAVTIKTDNFEIGLGLIKGEYHDISKIKG